MKLQDDVGSFFEVLSNDLEAADNACWDEPPSVELARIRKYVQEFGVQLYKSLDGMQLVKILPVKLRPDLVIEEEAS